MFCVDDGRHRIKHGLAAQSVVDEKGLHHRARIGQARRFDNDGVEFSALVQQGVQGPNKIAAHRATDAAIVHFEQFFVRAQDQLAVDTDFAELVDDHRVTMAVILGKDTVQKRRFPGPEIAGQDGHGYRRGSVGPIVHCVPVVWTSSAPA